MKDLLSRLVQSCRESKYANWYIVIVFAVITFIKSVCFQWNVYHSIAISSIVTNPLSFWSFWMPKIAIICLITSFLLLSKKNIWSIFFQFILDIWILANMMYLRSNGLLLDGYAFTMIDNMKGFWNSCWVLFEWMDMVPCAFSVIYMVFLLEWNHKNNYNIKGFSIIFIISLLLNWCSFTLVRQFESRFFAHGVGNIESVWKSMRFNPFTTQSREEMKPMNKDYAFANFSVIHAFLFDILDWIDIQNGIKHPYQLTDKELLQIKTMTGTKDTITHDGLLLILLIESLESWAIQPEIMPNLCGFLNDHPIALIKYSKSQIIGGSSGDGQMIVNTGLLPVQEGATCFRFPYVEYPSIVDRSDSSVTILTHSAHCWNQSIMSEAYGYTELVEGNWQDSILIKRIIKYAQRGYKTIQGITITSHIPFEYHQYSSLKTPEDMPTLMAKYCKSLHLTDSGLKDLFISIDSIPEFKKATIVITGDHSIFWGKQREELLTYCLNKKLDWKVQEATCPVIIYSPMIKENVIIDTPCYQMDIFPTILHLIGCEDYYWHGFGVNLLDSVARNNRPISEEDAFILSDKMIRANYFATHIDK